MLGYILAAAVTKKVVEGIGETISDVASDVGRASSRNTEAMIELERIKQQTIKAERKATREAARIAKKERKNAEKAELNRLKREQQTRNTAPQPQPAVNTQANNNAYTANQMAYMAQMNNLLRQLYAKFAICYYIALADGVLSPEEKAELDRLCIDVYNKFPYPAVKDELLKIYNTPNMNFIVLEKYIRNVDPSVIASFLVLADEMASLDGNTTPSEKAAIYNLRKYLTDRTGYDYLSNHFRSSTNVNLQCQSCGSSMTVVPYENKAVCPYCGHSVYLQTARNAGGWQI